MGENPYSFITFPLLVELLEQASKLTKDSEYPNEQALIEAREKLNKAILILKSLI